MTHGGRRRLGTKKAPDGFLA
ncbi:protein of unknown function (plasmid) [Azospirillum baldaniorum]|uniref:Uncharacterized protein n=1 Tax=Azospirillum baldaniorum TaxID=1064539 RepID=A0A9P1JX84_9PROT|nr:protein of unknown function [Azospirillum baldaniorum]